MAREPRQEVIDTMKALADFTWADCKMSCRTEYSCCDQGYCEAAAMYARDVWGVELERVNDDETPFLGGTGCIVEPHLRPMCTAHHCEICSAGFKRGNVEWTEEYYRLRALADNALAEFEEILEGNEHDTEANDLLPQSCV